METTEAERGAISGALQSTNRSLINEVVVSNEAAAIDEKATSIEEKPTSDGAA